jgi:hypothetical protein
MPRNTKHSADALVPANVHKLRATKNIFPRLKKDGEYHFKLNRETMDKQFSDDFKSNLLRYCEQGAYSALYRKSAS